MNSRWFARKIQVALFIAGMVLAVPQSTLAHPHVFVDGGVDFVFDKTGKLSALNVTWQYDPFESLYLLSSLGVVPTPEGALTPDDRARLIRQESDWPEHFRGAAHLFVDGAQLTVSRPKSMQADFEEGRLTLRFRRELPQPIGIEASNVEVAFYEGTYYYDFSITLEPGIVGPTALCAAQVIHFDPDQPDADLQVALAKLGREETPEDTNVGATFADRIRLKCE